MTDGMEEQVSFADLGIWCGKTSPERSAATAERTSEPSSKRQRGSQIRPPLYLDLRKVDGLTQEPLWEMGGALLGEFSTLNFSECPSVAVESHLSQILEVNPHPKYSLSPRACRGILNRAERRGKELPPMLKTALIRQSLSKNELDALGGVKEYSFSTTEQEHLAPLTISECYGISAYESNAMKSSNPHSGVYKADTSRTLDNNGGNPACNQGGMIVLEGNGSRESHKGDGYKLSDKMYTLNTVEQHAVCCLNDQGGSVMSTTENVTGTLRAQEHGHQPIVYDARGNGNGEISPTITGDHQSRVTDYTALCIGNGQMCNMSMKPIANSLDTMHDQQAVMTYGLDRAAYNQGKNAKYNFSIEQEKIGAQVAKGPGAVATKSIVRRLTPLECERLQGYPDGWTDIGDWTDTKGKTHKAADSPRYKALGNSIAVPCWRFILQGISRRVTEHTMASLFDGIGGFPLIWEEINGSKSCRWVSEIEEFPIAVTKIRFEQE